jgi:hypothetical protein
MGFPQGINFRDTPGFVTDSTYEDPEHANGTLSNIATYPRTTVQGNNVGWEDLPSGINTRDRNAAIDRRLAGTHFSSQPTKVTYRIDLPAAGAYKIRLAAGDASNAARSDVELFDTVTSLGTLASGATALGGFDDATNTEYTAANWPGSNTQAAKTFASTICRLTLGDGTNTGASVNHVYIENAVALQVAFPTADITDGAWTPSTGADNYATLDETAVSDVDYDSTNSDSTMRLQFGSLATPNAGARTLSYRARGSAAKKLIARLYQSSTLKETFTVDPLGAPLTTYSQPITATITDYSDLQVEFEAAAATSVPTAAPTWQATGSVATGTTSCAPQYPNLTPPVPIAAAKFYCFVTGMSSTAATAPTMPAGWTLVGTFEGGSGAAYGLDVGNRRVTVFKKDTVNGSELPPLSVTVSLAGSATNTLQAVIARIDVPGNYSITESFVSGADSSAGTGFSATASSTLAWAANDLLCILVASSTDTATQASQSITASGVTFGTRTNRISSASTQGNDHRQIIDTVPVNSAGSASAPVYAYTASVSTSGPVGFLLLRAAAPTEFARITWAQISIPDAPSGTSTNLVIADALHTHLADNLTLSIGTALATSDTVHAHLADNVSPFGLNSFLTVADATHAHSADALGAFTASWFLAVQEALHAHGAESPTLSVGTVLAPQDTVHAHNADNVALGIAVALVVEDAAHAHAADQCNVSVLLALGINDTVHAHTVDSIVFTGLAAHLLVADAFHAHTAESSNVFTETALLVADTLHLHFVDENGLNTEPSIAHLVDEVILSTPLVVADFESVGVVAEVSTSIVVALLEE